MNFWNWKRIMLAVCLGFALLLAFSCTEYSWDEWTELSSSSNKVLSSSSSIVLPSSSSAVPSSSSAAVSSSSSKPSSSSAVLSSSSAAVSSSSSKPSSSSESPYYVSCKILSENSEFPAGVPIPIAKRPELKCIEKANPSNVIKLPYDDVLAWENDPPWSIPVKGKYDNIIVTIERDDRNAPCYMVKAMCEGTVTITGDAPKPSSSSVVSSSSSTPSSSSTAVVASNCSLNGVAVTIGTQVWMSENLNCDVAGSKCYNDLESNCAIYGRLYDWATAMALPSNCNSSTCALQIGAKHRGICPSGWHIPSNAEWQTLVDFAGGNDIAGTKLKATSDWGTSCGYDYISGTNNFGFAALPGGDGIYYGEFEFVGEMGFWWSVTEDDDDSAYARNMGCWQGVYNDPYEKSDILFSVRCVKD